MKANLKKVLSIGFGIISLTSLAFAAPGQDETAIVTRAKKHKRHRAHKAAGHKKHRSVKKKHDAAAEVVPVDAAPAPAAGAPIAPVPQSQ